MLVIYIWLAVVMGLLALLCYAQYTTEHQVNERIQEMDEFVKMLSQHTNEHFNRAESKIQDIRERIQRVKTLVEKLGDPVLIKDLKERDLAIKARFDELHKRVDLLASGVTISKSKRKESKDTL